MIKRKKGMLLMRDFSACEEWSEFTDLNKSDYWINKLANRVDYRFSDTIGDIEWLF